MIPLKKEHHKNHWRKLDNTAKIFSLDDKKNTNIFRYSVILKEKVDQEILKEALKISLDKYRAFKVKLGTGLFWNYLEFNKKEVIIKEEDDIPCQHINFTKNNDYLFQVTYYKRKINLDIFHVLTDGTGAVHFLKEIIYNYLDLKYNLKTNRSIKTINYQEQYLKNNDKNIKEKTSLKPAYQIPGKIDKNINNTNHYILNIDEIKKVCKNYNVTITEYLTAIYIYAMYLSLYNKRSKKEILIAVPINLRKYYQVDTLSNFFVCMNIGAKLVNNQNKTLEDVLKEVHLEFKEKLNKDKVKSYLARDVGLGMNISIRLIPLFIKKTFMKFVGTLVTKSSTSTLSNVEIIDIDYNYKKYIDNILVLVLVIPGRVQKIKCTICSFDKKLNITINSNINNDNFEKVYLNLLKKNIKQIKIISNNYTKRKEIISNVIPKNKKKIKN